MTMQGFFCTLIAAILGGYFGWCAATVHGLARPVDSRNDNLQFGRSLYNKHDQEGDCGLRRRDAGGTAIMILTRRKLIGGIGLLFAAPAIVRASSIMPVKSLAHLEGQPVIIYEDPADRPWMPFQQYSGFDLFTGEHRKEFFSLNFISPTAAGESAA